VPDCLISGFRHIFFRKANIFGVVIIAEVPGGKGGSSALKGPHFSQPLCELRISKLRFVIEVTFNWVDGNFSEHMKYCTFLHFCDKMQNGNWWHFCFSAASTKHV
jgi:hypothetical protein